MSIHQFFSSLYYLSLPLCYFHLIHLYFDRVINSFLPVFYLCFCRAIVFLLYFVDENICLAIYLSFCLISYLYISLFMYLSISVDSSIYLFIYLFIYLHISLSFSYLRISLFISLLINLLVCLSVYLYINLYSPTCISMPLTCFSVNRSVYLSTCLFVYLCIMYAECELKERLNTTPRECQRTHPSER